MTQIARNLTDPGDGFLRGAQYIILDRDPLYTAAFRRLLRDSGVKPLVLPAWSPNLRFFTEVSAFPLDEENVPHHVPIGSDEQWPI